MGQSSQLQEENIAKMAGATSIEGFLIATYCRRELLYKLNGRRLRPATQDVAASQ